MEILFGIFLAVFAVCYLLLRASVGALHKKIETMMKLQEAMSKCLVGLLAIALARDKTGTAKEDMKQRLAAAGVDIDFLKNVPPQGSG